ncbi:carbohydrate esterase family 4 protein [Hysterangium stoloniferum]|nr:carbohydrate esterase family 4 protein [Hysterangium stoloniferum]
MNMLFATLALLATQVTAQLATVYSSCKKANSVALTFDDGPYIYETDIVNTLNNAGIKGTFFVNGNNWECIYDASMVTSIKNAFASGHEFGSHTWHHYDLSKCRITLVIRHFPGTARAAFTMRCGVALQRIIGVNPAMMRPPYGSYNDQVRSASFLRNQSMILWDFDDGDSTGATVTQSKQDYTNIANQHPNNILTLNHETYQTSAQQVLPFAITTLKNKGYQFVTVSECLGITPYQWTAAPQARTSDWNCNI